MTLDEHLAAIKADMVKFNNQAETAWTVLKQTEETLAGIGVTVSLPVSPYGQFAYGRSGSGGQLLFHDRWPRAVADRQV